MSATAKDTLAEKDFGQLKSRLKTTWMSGDYDLFSRFLEKGAEEFYARLEVKPGARLLDVACGAGQLALIAARAGAKAWGCDIAANWLEDARVRANSEGLQIVFEEADAESLPFADGQFDVVTSLVGAMFAPRPDLVAAELTRVCRPGGFIAMANWTPDGFIGQMFRIIAKHIAPSGMPAPALWGDEATVRNRLSDGIAELRCTPRIYNFDYPFSPEGVVEFFRTNYGPMSRAFASLDSAAQDKLRDDLVQLWSARNYAKGDATTVDAEYLEVIAMRNEKELEPQQQATAAARRHVSHRAGLLADRLEEGASGLAGFAEGVSDAEWQLPVSATDGRTIGVIVHHVASMYPIEIEAARIIASGKPISDITWEAVASINANHARENGTVSKSAALDLLRRNSREAAAALRTFTDEELDHAQPFSLSFGAPVTAQFVIEDHALRHSWHHLARIRKALGR